LKGVFNTTSIESTLRSRFQGFAFSTNRWLFLSTLISAFLFGITDVIGLKVLFGLALAITSGLVMVPLTECVVSFPQKLRETMVISEAGRTYSFALIDELFTLAKRMGVYLKGKDVVRIAPRWINAAATIDGKVILGQPIAEEFDKDARKGILAHELAHLKAKHPVKSAGILLLTSIPVIFLVSFLHLPGIVNLILVFSAYGLILPMVSWYFEYEADAVAASFVGCQPVMKGLGKLADVKKTNIKQDTYSHPSISKRIIRLQRQCTTIDAGGDYAQR